MAMQMQPREMWDLFHEVGFGQKPPLAFPGLATGRLRPYKTWKPIEQATMSYGYGLSTSLFQLARAYSVFARGRRPGAGVPCSSSPGARWAGRAGCSRPRSCARWRTIARTWRAGEGGTAPKAQAVGYSVGGKTGTAHKQDGSSYASNKYRAWFVGVAPINAPRIIVAVMVDEPSNGIYFGGDVAAPVFSQVVQQTLRVMGVPPDLEIKQQIIARAQAAKAEEESF